MRIETTRLLTLDGVELAADIGVAPAATSGAVLAHPHPLYGGTRHHPLVDRLFELLPACGCSTVRFDFRGGGDSGGEHDGGELERVDVTAALDALAPFAGGGPLWLVGYSFGGLVSLNVTDPRVHGWVAVAPPLRPNVTSLAAADHRPKHLLVPEHDQFCDPACAVAAAATWQRTAVETIAMADHFLVGRTAAVAERVTHLICD